jgi:serine/threonine protein kinase/tetratricopeptide (TPR) repeat protein
MTPERWQEIERLYHAALERREGERAAFLAQACAGDQALQRDVETLLAQPATALGFLEAGAVAVSAGLLSEAPARDLVGQRIGPYEVLAFEGAGGMAEVYRARHTVLGRTDAIKILPAAFTSDPNRLARFKREARTLAVLNHPGIATIHGFEESDGVHALVMEFVYGDTLAERIARARERNDAAVPIAEAFDIGRQLAEALAAAHAKGIVHRDLKPANIKVTPEGVVKVLDFGLAKAVAGAGGDLGLAEAPTLGASDTRGTVIVGTPAYMSPEQARGQPVDRRTDVWAFGCVLYELLTGRAPFAGPTFTDTLAAIVEREPDWRALPVTTPAPIVQMLHRCLDKNSVTRLRDIGEARLELDAASRPPTPAADHGTSRRRVLTMAAAVVVLAATALAFMLSGRAWPGDTELTTTEKISVAVLPFRTTAVSEPMRFLGVGIPDAIITQLAGIQYFVMRPTSAVLRFENDAADPQQVGRALVSDYVLTGILQEAGDRLGVSVQLVRTQDGAAVWGNRYDVLRSDLLPLQGQIAQAIAEALEVRLTAAERERLFRRYTVNARAYEQYLQGRTLLSRGTRESMRQAVDLFQDVLTFDPGYVPARAGVALGSALMRLGLAPAAEAQEWRERAEREARIALQRDPQLAEAHEALAAVYRALEFDWDSTIEESRLALAMNPSLDRPHYFVANAFGHLGLLDLVEPEVQAGVAVNPSNMTGPLFERGWTRLMAGEFEEALPLLEEWNRLEGTNPNWIVAMGYYYAGDQVRAEEILTSLRGDSAGAGNARALLASFLAARQADGEARTLIKAVLDSGRVSHHQAYSLGAAYAQLGEFGDARRWLAEAARTGFPCYPWYARDPLLDPLRNDPEFQRLMTEFERSWRATAERYGAATS